LADDELFRNDCGKNARCFAEKHFSRKDLSERFVLLLEEVYRIK
jgi:hypothetical protein